VLEVPQELMLTRVAKNKVRNLVAESLVMVRRDGEGKPIRRLVVPV